MPSLSPQRRMKLRILASMQVRKLSLESALMLIGVTPKQFRKLICGNVEPAVYVNAAEKISLCTNVPLDELHQLYMKVQKAKDKAIVRPQIFRCAAARFAPAQMVGIEEAFEERVNRGPAIANERLRFDGSHVAIPLSSLIM